MNAISGWLQRVSGRHQRLALSGLEPKLIQRLHQRMVDALMRCDRGALGLLLAADTEWRRDKQIVNGRDAVIDALFDAGGTEQMQVSAAEVRVLGELAVVDTLWLCEGDCTPRRWMRSCIFALRRGYWQVVSLRDLAFEQAVLTPIGVRRAIGYDME